MTWGALAGAAVGGGMSIGGSALSGLMNRAAMREQMKWQESFYKHRYQWTMDDMRAAGLNPMLAYSQGGGGVPSGATASFPNIMEGAAATARGYAKMKEEIDLMEKNERLLEQQEKTAKAAEFREHYQGALNEDLARKARADAELSKAAARGQELENRLKATTIPAAEAQMKLDETRAGEALRWLNRAIRSVTGRDTTSSR